MNRYEAWRACQVRFAMRLCGQAPMKEPETEFDVQSIVDSVGWNDEERKRMISEGFNACHKFDQRLFDQLKRNFEGAWR